jgi:hypothetical protein
MIKLNRKKFLIKLGFITLALGSARNIFSEEINMDRKLRFKDFNTALAELKLLEQNKVTSSTNWNLSQILNHCAQSIEYSMVGYPELKSIIFRKTIGKIAISVFLNRGYMNHGLNDEITGAPKLPSESNLKDAFNRLYNSIDAFKNFTAELKPHLAYDNLSKEDYEAAHAMHIANHLSSVSITA